MNDPRPGDWVVLDSVPVSVKRTALWEGPWKNRTLTPSLVLMVDEDTGQAWMSDMPNDDPLEWWSAKSDDLLRARKP